MPLTEKKGRFLIHTQCPASDVPSTSEKRIKRGRFTVTTCLPCVRPSRTHSVESEGTCLRDASATSHSASEDSLLGKCGDAFGSRSESLSAHGSAHTSTRDSTPCKDQQHSETSSWESSSTCSIQTQDSQVSCDASSPAKPLRRVRFSEPDSSTAFIQPVLSLPLPAAAQLNGIRPSNQHQQRRMHSDSAASETRSPASSCFSPTMRSYCRGRFVVQEAVLASSSLPRSASLPHCTMEYIPQRPLQQGCSQAQQTLPCTPSAAPDRVPDSYWAAASAAATGEVQGLLGSLSDSLHEYGTAASMQRHPKPPARSQSVSYFRRGRSVT